MQAMASESDSPVDQLRTLINSMAGLPNLADDFTEEQLQKLAAAGYRRAQQLGRVNREELQALGIPLALAADLQAGGQQRPNPHLAGHTLPIQLSLHRHLLGGAEGGRGESGRGGAGRLYLSALDSSGPGSPFSVEPDHWQMACQQGAQLCGRVTMLQEHLIECKPVWTCMC